MASLARFVDGYVGEPGAPFRHAVADHFGVSRRTVESVLPRAVEHGALTVEVLPGRGAPKAYRAAPGYLASLRGQGRTPKYSDLVRSGDMPRVRTPWLAVMETHGCDPRDKNNLFVRSFWLGVIAYCPFCLGVKSIAHSEDPLPTALWPVCGCRPTQLDEESGTWVPRHMISAWSMGFIGAADTPPRTPPEPRPQETMDEFFARMDLT